MQLPEPWVDRLFEKLAMVYGREFLARWDGIDLADVKDEWALELGEFARWPEAIKYALGHLPPDRPPTVLQLREICRKAPARVLPELPAPSADPERVQAELDKLLLHSHGGRPDPKDWARRILARNASGEKVASISIRWARETLQVQDKAA